MTTSPAANANGHRRRQLRARVLAEEETCALCGEWVDKSLHHLDPMAPVVDEDVPRSRGGSPYHRANCHLMHRVCNRWKSTMTLAEAQAKRANVTAATQVKASSIW